MKIIIACRHGEAYKNLKNVYGGTGSGLTDVGIQQVESLAEKLKGLQAKQNMPVYVYKSCDRVQINQSSQIIADALGQGEVKTDEKFCPIRLGVFDGMSRKKQQELYPSACEAHVKWERGEIDITESECLVDGMQKASDYVEQMRGFLNSLPDGGIYVLCGTRSDMSCLHNIFLGNDPNQYKSYKYYDFTYAGITTVAIDENNKVAQHNYEGINNVNQKASESVDRDSQKVQ